MKNKKKDELTTESPIVCNTVLEDFNKRSMIQRAFAKMKERGMVNKNGGLIFDKEQFTSN